MEPIFGFIKLIVILGVLGYGMYFIANKVKKQRLTRVSPNRLIQVIDGVQIGLREDIVLLKIGKEYILLSAHSGHMLALNQEEITAPEGNFDDLILQQNPSLTLTDFMKRYRKGVKK